MSHSRSGVCLLQRSPKQQPIGIRSGVVNALDAREVLWQKPRSDEVPTSGFASWVARAQRTLPGSSREPARELMTERLRVGIAGAGLITARAHLPALLTCAHAEFVALADSSVERARELAERFGQSPRIAADVSDLLDGVDAMIIATPNHSHRDLALKCLAAGVHVLIEKPLATSLAEGEAIVAASNAAGKIAAVGYNRRFLSAVPLMKELLQDAYFGDLRRFGYQFGAAGGWAPLSGYNLRRQSAGGGVLTVEGSHFLDRLIYWFGWPNECSCFDDSRGGPEASVVCRFRYGDSDSSLQGEARLSKTVFMREGFALETTKGLVLFREAEDELTFYPSDRQTVESRFRSRVGGRRSKTSTHLLQLEDFVAACLTGRPPRVPAKEALSTQRLIDHLYAVRQPLAEATSASEFAISRRRACA